MIALIDALNKMDDKDGFDRKIPFDIKYVQYSRTTRKGGAIIELKNAITVGSKMNLAENAMRNVRCKHNNNHPYPIHIRLILEFNGEQVFY